MCLCLWPSVSFSLSLSFSVLPCLCLSVSVCVSLYLYLSFSISISISLSLSLSPLHIPFSVTLDWHLNHNFLSTSEYSYLALLSNMCRVLAEIFPDAQPVERRVRNNRKHWERKAQFLRVHNNSAQSMSVEEIIALGETGEEEQQIEQEEKMETNQHNGR